MTNQKGKGELKLTPNNEEFDENGTESRIQSEILRKKG